MLVIYYVIRAFRFGGVTTYHRNAYLKNTIVWGVLNLAKLSNCPIFAKKIVPTNIKFIAYFRKYEQVIVKSLKLIPAKLIPAKLIPAKLIPAKLIPAKLIPAKLVPAKLIPAKSTIFKIC